MRPVFQQPFVEDPERVTLMPIGLPACLASLLEIALSDVPDLRCTQKQNFWQRANLWLAMRKLQLLSMAVNGLPTETVLGYHIRIGHFPPPTPLTIPPTYALVYNGKKLAHDPNYEPMMEKRAYALTPVQWLLLPLDPRR